MRRLSRIVAGVGFLWPEMAICKTQRTIHVSFWIIEVVGMLPLGQAQGQHDTIELAARFILR